MFNDFLTTGNDKQAVTVVIQAVDKGFAIRDLGSLHYFLGIEVQHNSEGVLLSQQR